MNGTAGGIRSAVSLVQGLWYAKGATGTTVTMSDGSVVTVGTVTSSKGVPVSTAGGIDNAITRGDLSFTGGAATATFDFSTVITNCNVIYTGATGVATVTTSGC